MFDCAGYVFGSGLVFGIEKNKKEVKKERKKKKDGVGCGKEEGAKTRGWRNRKKNRATFAVFNLPSGGRSS